MSSTLPSWLLQSDSASVGINDTLAQIQSQPGIGDKSLAGLPPPEFFEQYLLRVFVDKTSRVGYGDDQIVAVFPLLDFHSA